jgi:hypothetical protein
MEREPKKTDFLEVRLAWETKRAFMAKCRENGISASRLVRGWIHRYVHGAPQASSGWPKELPMLIKRQSRIGRIAAATLAFGGAGIAIVTLAFPASAASDPRLDAVFDWMDSSKDRSISAAEFRDSETRPAPPLGAVTIIVDSSVPPPASGETREALFARMDADRDAVLSVEEFAEGAVARTVATAEIAAADSNRDGALTEGELAAYLTACRAAAGEKEPSRGAGSFARGIVLEHDRDEDGKVPIEDLVGTG